MRWRGIPVIEASPKPAPRLGDRLRSVFLGLLGDAGTDGDLLTQYVRTRDDVAFAELVRRLGPMVRGVCRSVLGPGPDADDAFQATFIVLARKAETISPPGRAAAWVYGVASLAARKSRNVRRKRAWREAPMAPTFDAPARPSSSDPDLGPVLADEIGRLPEKYRLPIVLCLVRELTAARAATELGWPVGTVNTRLSRGRAMLGDRLVRRGLGFSAVSAGAVAADVPAEAAGLPSELILDTTRAATAGAALVPTTVLSLTSEVLAAMSVSKIRLLVAGGLLAVGVAATGVGHLMPVSTAAAPPPTPAAAKDPLDRIKLIRLTNLVKPDGIQQDLGLTDDQKAKIESARKKLNEDMQATIRGQMAAGGVRPAPVPAGGGQGGGGMIVGGAISGVAAGEMSKAMGENQSQFDKAVLAALSETQVHRLKQIFLQTQGASALLDRRVIRALALTADQEDEIEKAIPTTPVGSRAVTEERVKEMDTVLAAAVKVLTPEQKARWEALVGKPVPTQELLLAGTAAGGSSSFSVAGGGAIVGPAGAVPPAPVPIKP